MARYTGPKCKLCRREGVKLFLKGSRCLSENCAFSRRPQPPGVHGSSRIRLSDYARGLREKQKAKRIYGVLERQFRRYFIEASRHTGSVGETLLRSLELRLDNVVYLLGMAASRSQARQMLRQRKIKVDGQVVTIPSYSLKESQVISFVDDNNASVREVSLPSWLDWNKTKKEGIVKQLPTRGQIAENIDEQLIIEHYSR